MSSIGKAIYNKYNSCRTFPGLVTKYSEVLSKFYNLIRSITNKKDNKIKIFSGQFYFGQKSYYSPIIICFMNKRFINVYEIQCNNELQKPNITIKDTYTNN